MFDVVILIVIACVSDGFSWDDIEASDWSTNIYVKNGTFHLPGKSERPPTFSYMSYVKGVCRDIPADVGIEILYTVAGISNYVPVYAVIGAKIRLDLSMHIYCRYKHAY